jgi:hypothetical protein
MSNGSILFWSAARNKFLCEARTPNEIRENSLKYYAWPWQYSDTKVFVQVYSSRLMVERKLDLRCDAGITPQTARF